MRGFLIALFVSFAPGVAAGKVVGVILPAESSYYESMQSAFQEKLLASAPGTEIIVQRPAMDLMAWTNAARRLESLDVDVVVTLGTDLTRVAARQLRGRPIVYAALHAVDLRIESSDVTGVMAKVPFAGIIKQLQSVRPVNKLAVLFSSKEPAAIEQAHYIKSLQKKLGFAMVAVQVDPSNPVSSLPEADAVLLTTGCLMATCVDAVGELASSSKIMSAAPVNESAEPNILLTVTADPREMATLAAASTARLLEGSEPSDVPIVRPTRMQMIVNMKVAKAIGAELPFDLLAAATRVIK